ncbi:thioredoxin H3-like [Alnus glutinosa]|uniref:thioredoxin H3-like n=1 Tax=Alnus glutinosa TaxID=3517 RepID=UPI002D76C7D1|nr:thioredoxin H3-like [Alnus glutinosa]
MGSNFSDMEHPRKVLETRNESETSHRVLAFHSKDQWKSHFEASKQTDKLLVIDFTATWCGPCRFIEPAFKEFSAKYRDVEFVKIDVDELDSVAREFAVEAMPTFIFIKKGEVVDKLVGATKEGLQKKIEKHRT